MHLDGHSWAPTPVIPHRCWLDTFVGCVWDVRDLNLRGFAECSSCCNHVITHDELVCLFLIDVLSGLSNNRFSGSLPSALPQFVISLWDLALSSWNFSDYLYNFTAHSETTWYQEPLSTHRGVEALSLVPPLVQIPLTNDRATLQFPVGGNGFQ